MSKQNARGNKARRDKMSIKAHAENMLKDFLPMRQRMPKADRLMGAPVLMVESLCGIIREYSVAYACPEVRLEHIQKMTGNFGLLMSAFSIVFSQGLLTDKQAMLLCEYMERIEEGVSKWRISQTPMSSAAEGRRANGSAVHYPAQPSQESAVSI